MDFVTLATPVIFDAKVPVCRVSWLALIVPPVIVPPVKTTELVIVLLLRSKVPPATVMALVPNAVADPVTSVPLLSVVVPV